LAPFDDGDLAIRILSSPGRFNDVQVLLHSKNGKIQERKAGQLLFIGDSFSWRLAPYLRERFAESRFVGFGNLPVSAMKRDGPRPAVLILEVAERYLTNIAEWDFDWTQFCLK